MKIKNKGAYLAVLCSVTYIMAYLNRINLSSAVIKMADGFRVSAASIGIFGTLQAIVYAAGQSVNGPLITRREPGKIIAFAAAGTGIANLLMSFTGNFTLALIIWAVNAYIQSFIWGSIVRIIDTYPESRSSSALMWLMLSMPAAYILSWSVIAGALDSVPDWHLYFRIPGILILFTLPFWLTLNRTCPETGTLKNGENGRGFREVLQYIREHPVGRFLGIGFLSGFIREGILFWAPVMVARILSGTNISPYLIAAVIPLARTPAPVVLSRILKKDRDQVRLICCFFAMIFLLSVGAFFMPGKSGIPFAVLLAVLTFLICVIGAMMSLYIPLSFAADDMSAPIAGIFDTVTYIGASISTSAMGKSAASEDPSGAVIFWAAAAFIGILITLKGRDLNHKAAE